MPLIFNGPRQVGIIDFLKEKNDIVVKTQFNVDWLLDFSCLASYFKIKVVKFLILWIINFVCMFYLCGLVNFSHVKCQFSNVWQICLL